MAPFWFWNNATYTVLELRHFLTTQCSIAMRQDYHHSQIPKCNSHHSHVTKLMNYGLFFSQKIEKITLDRSRRFFLFLKSQILASNFATFPQFRILHLYFFLASFSWFWFEIWYLFPALTVSFHVLDALYNFSASRMWKQNFPYCWTFFSSLQLFTLLWSRNLSWVIKYCFITHQESHTHPGCPQGHWDFYFQCWRLTSPSLGCLQILSSLL